MTDISVTSTLRFVAGRELDGPVLGEVSVPHLRSGESHWVAIQLPTEPSSDVSAVITPDETLAECLTNNNVSRATLVQVRAADPFGTFDTQAFLANLEDSNSPPAITSAPATELKQGLGYG